MRFFPLSFFLFISLTFSQSSYNGLVRIGDKVYNCGLILGKYAHGGVPALKENNNVNLCCRALKLILLNEGTNPLLTAHLDICRKLGR